MRYLRTIFTVLMMNALAASSYAQSTVTSGPGLPNVTVTTGDSTSSVFHIFNLANTQLLRVQANGYVGINTVPAVLLDLKGNNVSAGGQLRLQATDFAQITFYNSNNPALNNTNRLAGIWYDIANTQMHIDNHAGSGSLILNGEAGPAGKVGIGTVPAVLLDLKGNNVYAGGQLRLQAADFDQITFYDSNNAALSATNRLADIYYDVTYTKLYIENAVGTKSVILNGFPNSGSVGIATTSPTGLLQIGATSPARFEDSSTSGVPNGVVLDMADNSEIHIAGLTIGKTLTPVIQTAGQSLLFNRDTDNDVVIGGSTHLTSGLQVLSKGPSNFAGAVHVTGNIIATGTVTSTFQDVAEWVPSSEQMPPGTVVVVSDHIGNTVAPSMAAYDTRVAGVVSAAPGVLLGVESSSKSKIATTGRVKVRVDATKGPIRLGDLLVTSDQPGVAMKSEPLDLGGVKLHRPGTLIGKALEPLSAGQGEILVLLSLQ